MSACSDTMEPLDLGVIRLGTLWDGCAWGVVDPATRQPLDLSNARADSHWRPAKTARKVLSPDTPALSWSSEGMSPTMAFEDGDTPLEDLTFDEFMAARVLSSDPLPEMGYPWFVVLLPRVITGLVAGEYDWDVRLDPDPGSESEPCIIRAGSVIIENPVTRIGG